MNEKLVCTKEEVSKATLEYFKGDELAANVWITKYALRDLEDNYYETSPDDMHSRLATEFARIEKKYPNPMSKDEIYGLLKDFKYIVPQGSPMSGIGNPFQVQSISNCFVIDSPHDSYGGILFTDQQQVQIMKRRGGVGFDISNIRPRGIICANAARTTDGIELFMERFSNSCREVAQGGRRGALMLSISVHHPQVMDFIKIKRNLTKITGANISVRISDDFMRAVKSKSSYKQQWPVDSDNPEIICNVDANEVWNEIITSAHASAEPGILFWDTALAMTPSDAYTDVGFGSTSTNPCVSGDSIVETDTGPKTIKELADSKANFLVKSYNVATQTIEMKPAIAFMTKEDESLIELTTESGRVIKLTVDHRVYTNNGWKAAGDLNRKYDKLICFSSTPKQRRNLRPKNRNRPGAEIFESLVKTRSVVEEDVYDLTVEGNHNFFANDILVHNCGEIILSPGDSCRLMLVNLTSFIENPWTEKAEFNFEHYGKVVQMAQRLMDDMIDLEIEQIDKIIKKINNDPEPENVKRIEFEMWNFIKEQAINGRRTGLGITGLGDAVAMLGEKYGSEASIVTVENFYKHLAIGSYTSSITLAKERGAFPVHDWNKEVDHPFLQRIFENLTQEVKEDWVKYGRRNIANTTTAPAGSVSCLTQTTSGIEPAFMLHYTRRRKVNPQDGDVRIDFVDNLGDKWQEYNVYHHKFKEWLDSTDPDCGWEDDPAAAVSHSPYAGATANEIDWVSKVWLQAAAQKWVCHAISSTCNLPADIDIDTVKKVYEAGWETGCKGITIYRDGSRSGVLVSPGAKGQKEKAFSDQHAPKRPEVLACDIHHASVKGERWVMMVGMYEGKPYEIIGGSAELIEIPKKYSSGTLTKRSFKTKPNKYDLAFGDKGEEIIIKDIVNIFDNPNYAGHTRTISLALRHGAPVQYLVEQLQKDKEMDMFSFSKCIARCLKKYIKDGSKASVTVCDSCSAEGTIIYQEGCELCTSCGGGKCG
jgi:ribonucleoside-diphosphate reductase alpha chain